MCARSLAVNRQTSPRESSMTESAELTSFYDIISDDIKHAKRQQWAVTYYVLLTYAAIIGFYTLIKKGWGFACWDQRMIRLVPLLLPALGIHFLGIWYLMHTHRQLAVCRIRLRAIKKRLAPATQRILKVAMEKEEKWASFGHYFWMFTFPFISLIFVGLLYVAWFLLQGELDLCFIGLVLLIIDVVFVLFYRRHSKGKVQEAENLLRIEERIP